MKTGMTFELIDHTYECIQAKNEACLKAAEMIGLQAEGYAKMLCPVGTPESTGIEGYHGGTLRNSITHTTEQDDTETAAILGSPTFYAVYVEHGTGIYADNGNGRKTPWVWVDENGKGHRAVGMQPRHFFKNAISDHLVEYELITENCLKGG